MAKQTGSIVTINKTEGMTGFVLFLSWVGALVYFINQDERILGSRSGVLAINCMASICRV